MSKKMEEEYRKMIAQEVPDLWERIESELPRKKYIFRSSYIRFAAGAAAAAAIMCIAFPAVRTGTDRMNRTAMDMAETEQTGQGNSRDAGVADEAVPEDIPTAEDMPDFGKKEREAPTEADSAAGSVAEDFENPAETETEEPEGDAESVEVAEGETGPDGNDRGTLTASADTEHEDVPVSVTGVRTVNGGKIYTATVLKDTAGGLAKGDELTLQGDGIGQVLKEGNEYSVSFAVRTSVSSQSVSGNTAEIYSLSKVKENEKTEE